MGCHMSKKERGAPGFEDPAIIASETTFTVNEVEALHELYKKISSSVVDDGYIQKEDFVFALFRNSNKRNLFADRIFDLFDAKRNGQIDFGEFVRALSIFHPRTPEAEKIACAFRLYDLRHTGYIEHEEREDGARNPTAVEYEYNMLEEMVLALLNESDLNLSDDIVKGIVDKTFKEADINGDGRIDLEEWKEYTAKNPSLLKNMTLPYLMDLTLAFPSFVMNSEANVSKMATQK